MRPEFLKTCSIPLSSDALSNFGNQQAEELWKEENNAVVEASRFLKNQLISICGLTLLEHFERIQKSNSQLIKLIHKMGINLRYLGLIDQELSRLKENHPKAHNLKLQIQSEMFSRAFKTLIQIEWRLNSESFFKGFFFSIFFFLIFFFKKRFFFNLKKSKIFFKI